MPEVRVVRVDPAGGGELGQGVRAGELPGNIRQGGRLRGVDQREDRLAGGFGESPELRVYIIYFVF